MTFFLFKQHQLRRWSCAHDSHCARSGGLTRKLQSTPTGMLLMGMAAAFGARFNSKIAHCVRVVRDSGTKMQQQ
jgi:hypothetical protein